LQSLRPCNTVQTKASQASKQANQPTIKAKQSKAKQIKAKQSKAKQSKAKQTTNKQTNKHTHNQIQKQTSKAIKSRTHAGTHR
jgi:hypothetical protein